MKGKKGMFFVIAAIALISLFLLFYALYFSVNDRKAVNRRVETMNSFLLSLEKDLPRQIYISGFRFIFLIEKKIPRLEREGIPLVVQGNEIVWVAGWRMNDIFKIQKNTEQVLVLTLLTKESV